MRQSALWKALTPGGRAVGPVHARRRGTQQSAALRCRQHRPSALRERRTTRANGPVPSPLSSLRSRGSLTEKLMVVFGQQPRMRADLTACVTTTLRKGITKEREGLKGKLQILQAEGGREGEHASPCAEAVREVGS